jgi:hypothetical protein
MLERIKKYVIDRISREKYEWNLVNFYHRLNRLETHIKAKYLEAWMLTGIGFSAPGPAMAYLDVSNSEHFQNKLTRYAFMKGEKELKSIINHGKRALELSEVVEGKTNEDLESSIADAENLLSKFPEYIREIDEEIMNIEKQPCSY